MLKPNRQRKPARKGGHFVIIASRYNQKYVDGMLRQAQSTLRLNQADSSEVIRVPGAFEIPAAAARVLAHLPQPPDAVICLGLIIRGETAHADHIGEAITHALMRLQLETGVPMIHEVLLVSNEAQAAARCLPGTTNRGAEAAQTALAMAQLFCKWPRPDSDVPF